MYQSRMYRCNESSRPRNRHGDFSRWLYRPSGDGWLGRAVTTWSVTGGVRLQDFNPPEWSTWIDWYKFKDIIKKDWLGSLAGAYGMNNETASRAIELYLAAAKSP